VIIQGVQDADYVAFWLSDSIEQPIHSFEIATQRTRSYSPFYHNFLEGCTPSETSFHTTRNSNDSNLSNGTYKGTMLTENVYSLAYQYALSEGEKVTGTSLASFNMRISTICSQQQKETTQAQLEIEAHLAQVVISLQQVQNDSSRILGCIDVEEVGFSRAAVNASCAATNAIEMGPVAPIVTSFLEPIRFNCSTISPPDVRCDTSCEGPTQEVSRSSVVHAKWNEFAS
jgi:hypothetical protein